MTRHEAIERLLPGLTDSISDWLQKVRETTAGTDALFLIGDDTERLMARAALSVLEAVGEVQEYAESEGYMKRELE